MFEYDSQTALDESKSEGNILRVRFPYAGLLLLRKSPSSPDRAEVIIETPKGEVSYDIKIIKISDFSIDSIFENRLYLMIPFYIFNYESEFISINEDAERTEKLADVFRNIIDRLDEELEEGNLSALSHNVIIRLTHKVVYKLTMKHGKVQDKVGGIMGGKVLDLPEIKVFHEGKAEGRAEGLKEGEAERKKLADKNTELEDENASLKAELEALKKQMKK